MPSMANDVVSNSVHMSHHRGYLVSTGFCADILMCHLWGAYTPDTENVSSSYIPHFIQCKLQNHNCGQSDIGAERLLLIPNILVFVISCTLR